MLSWLRALLGLPKAPVPSAIVRAAHGVAAGRDITDSNIIIGLDEEGVGRVLEKTLVRIGQEKGIPLAPLQAILAKLGEAAVPAYEIPMRLDAAADELIAQRVLLAQQKKNERPEFAIIREQALALIDKGDFDAARLALVRGRDAARASQEEASRLEAEFLGEVGRIDHLQLAYRSAAQNYAQAASVAASFDTSVQSKYLIAEARALSEYGRQFGDNPSLAQAINLYRRALKSPLDGLTGIERGAALNDLGVTLTKFGERDRETTHLNEAVGVFHEALKYRTRELALLDWATTQTNLATALQLLGRRETNAHNLDNLKAAVTAYHEALTEEIRRRAPYQWAAAQNNLSNSLLTIWEREGGTYLLEAAVGSARSALRIFDREQTPHQWAAAQNNLGNALAQQGMRDRETRPLKEAIAAFREALTIDTRERAPMEWALTQNNLGNALVQLGTYENDTSVLEEAVVVYRGVLEVRTRKHSPLDWADTQNNLGVALLNIGRRESGTARLNEAVAAFQEALKERTRKRLPHYCAQTESNLGLVRAELVKKGVVSMRPAGKSN